MLSFRRNSIKIFISIILLFSCSAVVPAGYCVEEGSTVETAEKQSEKLVGKINFEDVLAKAKDHSYDLKIADYNILIAKQNVRGARSEYFPKLNFGGGMEYTKNYRDIRETTVMSIGEAFINPYTRFQSVLGINVMYNLFDFGVRGGNLKIAKKDVKIKELENKQKYQDMSMTLLDTYTKILITTKQIDINKEILNLEQKTLELNERLYKAKEISKTELNDSKVRVSNAKNRIYELKSIRNESINWLSFYTGEEYDSENLKISDLKKSDFDVLKFQDYTKSIIWKIHEENIKKKELELQVAKRNNYPKLNAYGRYYWYGSNHSNYPKSLDIEPSNLSVGASLSMPLFDGLKNSALIQKTALELKQLQVERDKAIAELATKLAVMRSNLMYLDEQIDENSTAIKELTDKENSTHKLVNKRLASPIEENNAKVELLNQKIELSKNSITQIAITRGIQILTEEE